MDFLEFSKLHNQDDDYPQRTFDLQMFKRVLDGKLYNCLPYAFYQTVTNGMNESIPLSKRRPSVRYRLCKVVVDQSVALLFGEGRFPTIICKDDLHTKETIDEIAASTDLNLAMTSAAILGSVGSIAIILKLINGRIFFEPYCTEYLTPFFNPENPDELQLVREKCKKKGKELIEMGYVGLDKCETYWWMREWDSAEERYFVPWKVSDDLKTPPPVPQVDKERTKKHDLGFVPMVWILNLPGSDNAVDGLCTFEAGIDTNIELDYQLSQGGRGLKYSSEPLLMIKNPSTNMQGDITLCEGNVIEVAEDGDAKHVEISGKAIEGVLTFSARLREVILENIHGNRSNPEKLHTVQSAVGMKTFYQPLIWVADKLRITYGGGLLKILNMIVKCNQLHELFYESGGQMVAVPRGTLQQKAKISLQWQDWFAATNSDRLQEAQTLASLTKNQPLMTQETAVNSIAAEYDIVDTAKELLELERISAEQDAREDKMMTAKAASSKQK